MQPKLDDKVVQPTQADYLSMSNVITRCLREVDSKDYPDDVIEDLVARHSPEKLAENLNSKFSVVLKRLGGAVRFC